MSSERKASVHLRGNMGWYVTEMGNELIRISCWRIIYVPKYRYSIHSRVCRDNELTVWFIFHWDTLNTNETIIHQKAAWLEVSISGGTGPLEWVTRNSDFRHPNSPISFNYNDSVVRENTDRTGTGLSQSEVVSWRFICQRENG